MMNQKLPPLFIGDTLQKRSEQEIKGEYVSMLGGKFYKIKNYDNMAPFFMSIISSSNHWLFISSTGGALGWEGQRRAISISLLHR